MFQILANAPNRLILRMGRWPFQTSTIILDKPTGKGRFERTIFFWKRRPIDVPLDEIAEITVVHQEKTGAKGRRAKSDNPIVQLKSGQRFWLSDPGDPKSAIEAVRQMCVFLGQPAPESEAAAADPSTAAAATADAAVESATAPAAGEQPGESTPGNPPIVAPPPSRIYRWATLAVSLVATAVFLVIGAARVANWLTLPECDDETTRNSLTEIFDGKKIKIERLSELKTISSTRAERMCEGRADIPGGIFNLAYRIDWGGWSKRVTIVRADAEVKIEPTRLEEVKKAADDFLAFARDSHVTGRAPRQSEPPIRELLDKVFDLSELDGTPLTVGDVTKALDWFTAGDRVGTVYILAGTGIADINKLTNDAGVQRRTHRNVAEFAGEFARYLDFQIKLAGIMMEAELNRTAKASADVLNRPEVRREIADVRSTLAETLTGTLTTLAYDGLTDEWRRQRLRLLMEVAPKASQFLSADQARAVREHALRVATYQRDGSVEQDVKSLADRIAGR